MNPSDFMRLQLASAGIFLDEPKERTLEQKPERQAPEPVDRDMVREILVAAGAPTKDLDWMVASCPGVEYALGYRTTVREAWCVECDGVTDGSADRGCFQCRARELRGAR